MWEGTGLVTLSPILPHSKALDFVRHSLEFIKTGRKVTMPLKVSYVAKLFS